MRRISLALMLVLASASNSNAQRYVYGSFCSTCLEPGSINQLYDDGRHHDGAAGDGVWGADIVSDVVAGSYSWFVAGPSGSFDPEASPRCLCAPPPAPATLWTSVEGETIHFWEWGVGGGVACDHGIPPGAEMEVAYTASPPVGWGGWSSTPGEPMTRSGSIWSRVLTIPEAGEYMFQVRSTDRVVSFSPIFNARCGLGCTLDEVPVWHFTTTTPNTDVRIQFDDRTGRQETTLLTPTATRQHGWGALKAMYR